MSRTTSTPTNSPIGGQFTSVASAVGFSTGDLVYRTNSGYGRVPDGSVLTATFPNSVTAPVYASGPLETTQVATDSVNAGGQNDQCAARLNNGNIVVVYTKPANTTYQQGHYYFRIVDTAGAVVVAETIVDAANYSNNSKSCSVVALSGGGFAVAYRTNNAGGNYFYLRSFDSTGSPTSSAITDPIVYSTNYLVTKMVARTDGGYMFAGINSSSQGFVSIRTATSGASNTFGTGSTVSEDSVIALERFSDNSYFVVQRTAATTITWWYRNSAGGAINTGTVTTTGAANSISACRLNSNTIAVYCATNSGLEYFRYAQGGSPTTPVVVFSASGSSGSACAAYTKSGTNTNIVLFSYDTTTAVADANSYGGMSYYIIDGSTGAVQGSTTPRFVSGFAGYLNRTGVAFVEFDTTIRAYVRGSWSVQTDVLQAPTVGSTHFINFNNSTFVPETFDSAGTKTIGSTTAQPVNLYSRTAATPTAGSFVASASVNTSASITQGTVLVPQTTVESVACDSYQLISLSTGNTLALYKINSTNLIKFAVINNSGVITGIYTVATGYSADSSARACELSNGDIVIAYHASSTKINYAIYSSSFVLQSSGELSNLTTSSLATGNAAGVLSIAALTQSNRFAVGYVNTGGSGQCNFYSSSAAYIYGDTFGGGSTTAVCCIGLKHGGVAFWYATNLGPDNRMRVYTNTAPVNANNYFAFDQTQTGTGSTVPYGFAAYAPANGYIPYFQFNAGTANLAIYSFTGSITNTGGLGSIGSSGSSFTSCCTAEGVIVVSNQNLQNFYTYQMGVSTTPTVQNFSSTAALPSLFATRERSCATLAPFYGPYFIAGVLNASRFPTYAVVSSRTFSYPVSITAGVTSSNPTTLPASSFALVGVAASDCPAGGVGQVQTSGTAVLNSSYPSTTSESFDFTNPATYGVKGAINGRVITMES